MSAVYLAAQSAVTALGGSLDEAWPRLLAGASAIAPIERFATGRLAFHQAACVPGLAVGEAPNLTCALLARCLSRLNWLGPLPRETAVIWAGAKGDAEWIESRSQSGSQSRSQSGSLPPEATFPPAAPSMADPGFESRIRKSIFDYDDDYEHEHEHEAEHVQLRRSSPSPECDPPDFFLPSHYRQWVCRRLGLCGAGLEVNAACASSSVALALGALMIERGEAESVLVCAADIVSRFTFTGFAALRGLTPSVCRPLDRNRDGLALGEAAAAVLLLGEKKLMENKMTPLARLAGWGIANDATHITAPARDGCGLAAAIRAALEKADCPPADVAAFCVHGTGTVYNDAMELTALEAVFGERRFPVFSVKGAVGHTLGAAGALEAAVCARALREGRVPATAGLLDPEARALGRAAAAPQNFNGNTILTTNSGFGGVNAALVLQAVEH